MINQLLNVTLTGVDEFTSLEKVKEFSFKYPLVEWGILFSEDTSRFSSPKRYPSEEWFLNNVEKIAEIKKETHVKFALHVCGKSVAKLLNNEQEVLNKIIPYFDRVQINFIYKKEKLEALEALFARFPEVTFITQHNEKNAEAFSDIKASNHQVLFDTSGGRGVVADNWQEPLSDKVYGYAGGLGPENVAKELDKIIPLVGYNKFWIDMETKVRTDDELDLHKCGLVLGNVNIYLTEKSRLKF